MKAFVFITILFVTISGFYGCGNQKNEVVVYTTVDQVFSEPILNDFQKETGITVKAVFDTEETKSTGVLNRIIAEKDNPQCDVFWSGDPARAALLKRKGITTAYNSPAASDIESHFKDKDFHWIGFSARARVLLYNTDLMEKKNVPTSIFQLAEKTYEAKATIANPLFGTTSFHFAALFFSKGDDEAKKFFSDLKNNGLIMATSNGDVRKRVAQGEIACGLTDTDDANEALKEGAPVKVVFLDQESGGLGSLIIPNTVSLLKNSPNSAMGKKLIDYLLSRETEKKLAASCVQMPLHKGVKTPEGVPSLDNILPMKIDYDGTAKKLEAILPFLKEWTQ
ncbi:MAG: extracellular solute-binding protein [bacterium]|nr:extracellular solute-binding protein [bacterium]